MGLESLDLGFRKLNNGVHPAPWGILNLCGLLRTQALQTQ